MQAAAAARGAVGGEARAVPACHRCFEPAYGGPAMIERLRSGQRAPICIRCIGDYVEVDDICLQPRCPGLALALGPYCNRHAA